MNYGVSTYRILLNSKMNKLLIKETTCMTLKIIMLNEESRGKRSNQTYCLIPIMEHLEKESDSYGEQVNDCMRLRGEGV